MRKKWIIWAMAFTVAIVLISFIYSFTNIFGKKIDRIVINGIENFYPVQEENTSGEEGYYLFYPADARVSQDFTIVKEVLPTGEIINEYEVIDDDFRRIWQRRNGWVLSV